MTIQYSVAVNNSRLDSIEAAVGVTLGQLSCSAENASDLNKFE